MQQVEFYCFGIEGCVVLEFDVFVQIQCVGFLIFGYGLVFGQYGDDFVFVIQVYQFVENVLVDDVFVEYGGLCGVEFVGVGVQ